MNFDFLKDLVGLNPIKTTYVSNNLRSTFNFILDDHEKEVGTCTTLLEKLNQIFNMFLNDKLDQNLVYDLFGNKLDLTRVQFNYLYDKTKNDVYITDLLEQVCAIIDKSDEHNVRQSLVNAIDDQDGFANIASFLIRECNNAAKIK
ncbi:hypothetical protein [Phthorimaea operculella granulovirus]|uniref:Uncharacterized protein n=1 Tax=Phthorimaea operculella granulovirus TaxID=192584 RepID=Q8JRV8_9BBAC|nr:hypothetical protein [Phthorimaea operculella granulovirus]AAM70299.1 hypothetical protein [Phthorimaea operculella granulovirus]ANY57490.1 hypothetical protein PhopGVgp101 [Phthorimaea operculella granulovirus]QBH65936.1 hypothetical protein PhopGVgp101 [Phthorimaea operculella granulovirus]QBH66066.1 hypothetical protein PhopGVgp101 [Phthorimaea operculella granulovirus]QBH66196.1 hypothetical protein PhopGVgp101 [Phthorimaea operculella granulovirus]